MGKSIVTGDRKWAKDIHNQEYPFRFRVPNKVAVNAAVEPRTYREVIIELETGLILSGWAYIDANQSISIPDKFVREFFDAKFVECEIIGDRLGTEVSLDWLSEEDVDSDNQRNQASIHLLDENGGEPDESVDSYIPTARDTRDLVERQIRARRGQQQFRDALRLRYSDTCIVTGCRIVAILEAAHINPYRGDNDNNPANGLLLRADLHTLFDLDLVGIDPDTLCVEIHPSIQHEYGYLRGNQLSCPNGSVPSEIALQSRHRQFRKRLANRER